MRKTLVAGVLALSVTGFAAPAMADSWGRHGHWGGHAHVSGDAFWIGAGIVVGAITLGALLSPPPYYGPPRVVYRAPPPSCVQDTVYRTLPDGRVQSGTRTTCY